MHLDVIKAGIRRFVCEILTYNMVEIPLNANQVVKILKWSKTMRRCVA
jgi:hypothetical protein